MHVFKVNFSAILYKLAVVPFKGLGAFPLQYDVTSKNFVPTRFEYCVRKHDSGRAVVVDANGLHRNFLNLGNVDRTGRVVADGNVFVDEKGLAIDFAELGRAGIRLGFRGSVGQHVGHDAFIPSFRRIVDDGITGHIQTLKDGARASASGDVFGSSAGLQKLRLSWRHANFNFFAYLKNTTSAFRV